MDFRMQDRMELKALVDFYATESDKNNQDCYVEIFRGVFPHERSAECGFH